MIFEIPIDVTTATADGELTFDVELDGTIYRLQLSYADCAQLWYADIDLVTSTETRSIVDGVAMVTGVPLLAGVQVADRPVGELILAGARDAGRNDLGSYVRLYYYDAEALAQVQAP